MTTDPLQATCAICGAQFEAHPGSFVEAGISRWEEPEESADELIEAGHAVLIEPWTSPQTLAESLGIEIEDAEKLISGQEHVDTGAECWCDKCIDEAFPDTP